MAFLGPLDDEPPEMVRARMEACERRIIELENLADKEYMEGDGTNVEYFKSLKDEAERQWRQIAALAEEIDQVNLVLEMANREQERVAQRLQRAGLATTPSSTKRTPKTVPASSSPSASSKRSSDVAKRHVDAYIHLAGALTILGSLCVLILGWIIVGVPPILLAALAFIVGFTVVFVTEVYQKRRIRREAVAAEAPSGTVAVPTYREALGGTTYFEPYTDCPKCGTEALHWIGLPAFDSEFADFDVVRECRAILNQPEFGDDEFCGHRWGQNALGKPPTAPIQGCIDPKTIGQITHDGQSGETAAYHCRCAYCCKTIGWIGNKKIPTNLPFCSQECQLRGTFEPEVARGVAWQDFRDRRQEAIKEAFEGVQTQDATDVYSALITPSGCRPWVSYNERK